VQLMDACVLYKEEPNMPGKPSMPSIFPLQCIQSIEPSMSGKPLSSAMASKRAMSFSLDDLKYLASKI
jgi:hypothetical protein